MVPGLQIGILDWFSLGCMAPTGNGLIPQRERAGTK